MKDVLNMVLGGLLVFVGLGPALQAQSEPVSNSIDTTAFERLVDGISECVDAIKSCDCTCDCGEPEAVVEVEPVVESVAVSSSDCVGGNCSVSGQGSYRSGGGYRTGPLGILRWRGR